MWVTLMLAIGCHIQEPKFKSPQQAPAKFHFVFPVRGRWKPLLPGSRGSTYATVSIPNTGSFNTWTIVTTNITLSAGTHTFDIAAVSGGWNINWFSISKT